MKIEFEEDDNMQDFITAINHAYIAYIDKVYSAAYFGLDNELPGPLYDTWILEKHYSPEQLEEKTQKDAKILRNFYNNLIKIEKEKTK